MAIISAGMLFSVCALTKVYLSYPVNVDASVRRERQIVFPAVTVCNMSPVKKSALGTADLSGASKRRRRRSIQTCLYRPIYVVIFVEKQKAFEKCWAHSPLRAAARRIAIHQVSLLSHAACASMSTTTTTTTTTRTTRDRGDRYGSIEWAQVVDAN